MKKIDAQKHINEIIAFANGKTIERKSVDFEIWCEEKNPSFASHLEYRIKPESKLVPFTFEDNLLFRDKWIYHKLNKVPGFMKIISYNESNIHIEFGAVGYEYFLKDYCFEDGSPCGKYIE